MKLHEDRAAFGYIVDDLANNERQAGRRGNGRNIPARGGSIGVEWITF